MRQTDLTKVPLGSFVKGRPTGEAREGYEYTDLICQVVYRNGPINRVTLLLKNGALDFFHPEGFRGHKVKKPRNWPKSLDNWQSREREFHIKTFDSRGLRPFDYNGSEDDKLLLA